MSSSSTVESCTVCNKKNAKRCARCKSTSYCSKTCQQDDWSTHKLLCASFSTFTTSNRPTADHYCAVLFDPDKAKPEFTWLLYKWVQDEEEGGYRMPEIYSLLGDDSLQKHMPIQYNPRLKRHLSNTISLTYRDTFLIDGSRPNRSVASVIATQPGEYHDWRGPIVAYAKSGQGLDSWAYRDLDMVDFRHAQANVERVKGVRINCEGDVKMYKRPYFEEIELPVTDSIFTEHHTSDIADRIGIPILTRRCPPDPKWANSRDDAMFEHKDPFGNQNATFLHQCCDPTARTDFSTGSLGWGWCSLPWQNDVGSAIAVRRDKKPLLPLHMEALAQYCRNEVGPLLGHLMGEYSPEEPIKKDDVLKIICRPMFFIYWSKFREERKDYTTPSPYDNERL